MSKIRTDTIHASNYSEIVQLVQKAFYSNPSSNGKEYLLVQLLFDAPDFDPNFAIAEYMKQKPVGFVLLTPVKSIDNPSLNFLALAPLVVHPYYQNQGIGKFLMEESIDRAKQKSTDAIVLVGDQRYYKRYGFEEIAAYGMSLPYPKIAIENHLIKFLKPINTSLVNGPLTYPEEFEIYLTKNVDHIDN